MLIMYFVHSEVYLPVLTVQQLSQEIIESKMNCIVFIPGLKSSSRQPTLQIVFEVNIPEFSNFANLSIDEINFSAEPCLDFQQG